MTAVPPARAGIPTEGEKRVLDSIAGSTARHLRDLQLLREINVSCGTKFTIMENALAYLIHTHNEEDLEEENSKLKILNEELHIRLYNNSGTFDMLKEELEDTKIVMAELECLVDLATINYSGLQHTLGQWKKMSREERMRYERISHENPVEEHPEIFIDTHGIIRLTNGRFA